MRRFIAGERSAMMEEQKKLMKARDAMDAARHEVNTIEMSIGPENFANNSAFRCIRFTIKDPLILLKNAIRPYY